MHISVLRTYLRYGGGGIGNPGDGGGVIAKSRSGCNGGGGIANLKWRFVMKKIYRFGVVLIRFR
jgi:hypothetical protein